MRFEVNGISLNVKTVGDGPPLLPLHGFTGTVATWYPFVPSWRKKCQLVMVDLIGHGKSDAPEDAARYAMDLAAADLAAVLDALAIARASVLGYSMGGRLALTFAERYPARVNALILEGSSPGLRSADERKERIWNDERLAQAIERDGVEAFVNKWEKIPLFASQQKLSAEVRARIRSERLCNRAAGLANSLRGMGTGQQRPLWHRLSDLHMPVLLVTGEDDHKFCRIASQMHCLLPQSRTERIGGAGHAAHVEQPHIFDEIVMDFLTKVGLIT